MMMDVVPSEARCAGHVNALRRLVNDALATLVQEREPADLYDPVRYVLDGGGKRLRPVLVVLAAEAFGAPARQALPAALAVEVFHNFTLVHDDIMDNADARRGRPTVHVRWDASTAILSGDYMMALAYDLLASTETSQLRRMLKEFHGMVTRLCEGQALDKAFETQAEVSVEEYLAMVDGKTAALVETSLVLGGLIGQAEEAHLAALRAFGRHLGRAFQIQDDLLDLVADDERWGKTIGGDLIEGKKTYLLLRTLERSSGEEHRWFARIVEEGGLAAALVPEARDRMARLGVLDEARAAVRHHSEAAREALHALPSSPAVHTLHWLMRRMQRRGH